MPNSRHKVLLNLCDSGRVCLQFLSLEKNTSYIKKTFKINKGKYNLFRIYLRAKALSHKMFLKQTKKPKRNETVNYIAFLDLFVL